MKPLVKIGGYATAVLAIAGVVALVPQYLVTAEPFQKHVDESTARDDEFEIKILSNDIRPLKAEIRDLRVYLRNNPGDSSALEDLDYAMEDMIELLSRKCFLMERNGRTCPEGELQLLTGEN